MRYHVSIQPPILVEEIVEAHLSLAFDNEYLPRLLMRATPPAVSIRRKAGVPVEAAWQMAPAFEVSTLAMQIRLVELGLILGRAPVPRPFS